MGEVSWNDFSTFTFHCSSLQTDSLLWSTAQVRLDPHSAHVMEVTTRQQSAVSAVERHNTGGDGGDLRLLLVKHRQSSQLQYTASLLTSCWMWTSVRVHVLKLMLTLTEKFVFDATFWQRLSCRRKKRYYSNRFTSQSQSSSLNGHWICFFQHPSPSARLLVAPLLTGGWICISLPLAEAGAAFNNGTHAVAPTFLFNKHMKRWLTSFCVSWLVQEQRSRLHPQPAFTHCWHLKRKPSQTGAEISITVTLTQQNSY